MPNENSQGTEQLPYYTYDLEGEDWTATFVVVDSDCFLSSYQKVCISPLRSFTPTNLSPDHIRLL
jgi:hypothetical protein